MTRSDIVFADGSSHRTKDIKGNKYHRLTALRPMRMSRDRCPIWEFRCECGNLIEIPATRAVHGRTLSCGCQRIDSAKKNSPLRLVGRQFGRLTVVKRAGTSKHRSALWECKCECGEVVVVPSISLTRGATRSCGCLKLEMFSKFAKSQRFNEAQRAEAKIRNRKKVAAYVRNRRNTDALFGLRCRISRNLSFALNRKGIRKRDRTFKLLPYTPNQLKRHIERQFVRGMTWENRHKWHIDHIVPLCTAESESEILALYDLSNLRPVWAKTNMAKNDKRIFLC